MTQTHPWYILIFRGLVETCVPSRFHSSQVSVASCGLSQFPAPETDSIFSEAIRSCQLAVTTDCGGVTAEPQGRVIAGPKIEQFICVFSTQGNLAIQQFHLHISVEQQTMEMGVLLNIGCAELKWWRCQRSPECLYFFYLLGQHHLPHIPLCLSLSLPFSYSIYTSFLSLAFECSSTFFRRWTSGRHYCCRNPRNGSSPKDCEYISLTFSHLVIINR